MELVGNQSWFQIRSRSAGVTTKIKHQFNLNLRDLKIVVTVSFVALLHQNNRKRNHVDEYFPARWGHVSCVQYNCLIVAVASGKKCSRWGEIEKDTKWWIFLKTEKGFTEQTRRKMNERSHHDEIIMIPSSSFHYFRYFGQNTWIVFGGFRDKVLGFVYDILFDLQLSHEGTVHCIYRVHHLHNQVPRTDQDNIRQVAR